MAGYEDVYDTERLARDPAMRAVIGREGLDRSAASSSEMGRFETGWLPTEANLAACTALAESIIACRSYRAMGGAECGRAQDRLSERERRRPLLSDQAERRPDQRLAQIAVMIAPPLHAAPAGKDVNVSCMRREPWRQRHGAEGEPCAEHGRQPRE